MNFQPSEDEWKLMRDSLRRIEVALIGEVGKDNAKCVVNLLARAVTSVYGPEGQPHKGIEYRLEAMELEAAREAAWRKGAIAVLFAIGSAVGVLIGWALSFLKKP